ncbi:MAG: zinc ABC transporter substrate-binding protein [Candidatus Izimaplasma sp.]|nr:zinc ABC transporter substrate-binding protein [Candidatus Izimaplasma bacterium]
MKKILLLIFTITTFSILASCTGNTTEDDRIQVAVSITPQAAFVDAVGKEFVNVITIIPPGYSPENYEPSPRVIAELNEVDVYFSIGVPAETGNIIPELDELKIFHLEDFVSQEYPDREFAPGSRDPHIWLSIKRVKVMIDVIAAELARLDPDNDGYYYNNARDYKDSLTTVDNDLNAIFADKSMRKFIVFHPSYGYFADDYNLEMYALEEEGKEATVTHLQAMVDLAKDYNINYVFHQTEIDSRQVIAFVEEIDAQRIELEPLAYDYLDNIFEMGELIGDSMYE